MKLQLEKIAVPLGQSFRLLRWHDNVRDVEVVPLEGLAQPFAGSGSGWHFHSEFEITLVTRGAGTRFIGDNIKAFDAIDVVLIGSGVPHYWHGLHDSSGYAVQFSVGKEHPLGHLDETRELEPLWLDAKYGIQFTGATQERVVELIISMPRQGGVGRFASFMRILETFLSAPEAERCRLSRKDLTSSSQLCNTVEVQKAISFILDNLQETITLQDAFAHTGMSKATFSRHFKAHTGKTFTQFLSEVRIDYAARQLVESSLSISEIAFGVGFNNLSHFNHTFRTIQGCAPSAIQRNSARK